MASFVILVPPGATRERGLERAVFIRDGFAWLGFLLPPLWLLWHRLWIEALVAVALTLGFGALAELAGFAPAAAAVSLGVSLFVGLEGQALRIARLRRQGWSDLGTVIAANAAEAEIRWTDSLDDMPSAEGVPAAPAFVRPAGGPAPAGPALGLFHYPGRN